MKQEKLQPLTPAEREEWKALLRREISGPPLTVKLQRRLNELTDRIECRLLTQETPNHDH